MKDAVKLDNYVSLFFITLFIVGFIVLGYMINRSIECKQSAYDKGFMTSEFIGNKCYAFNKDKMIKIF